MRDGTWGAEQSVLMIEAQQIGGLALAKAVHDVLRLPQRGAVPVQIVTKKQWGKGDVQIVMIKQWGKVETHVMRPLTESTP